MLEIWKDIKDYEGIYMVSQLGRVKSLRRTDCIGRRRKGMILKQCFGVHRYLLVGLSRLGKTRTSAVHKLVAMAFMDGKTVGGKIIIDHINNDQHDNRVCNLQFITQRENVSKDKKGFSSKYIGVSWCKTTDKWRAQIKTDGKVTTLGRFDSEEMAAKAYKDHLKSL